MNKEITYLSDAEIKNELIKMLQIVDKYAEEKNIQYSIGYGTLLGAVRHKGFIPWDDDIDLILKRSEYNKLVEMIKNNDYIIGKKLKCIGFELGNSSYPFIKIVNPNIISEEKVIDSIVERSYLFIDVFPIDAMPKHCKKLYKLYTDKFLRKLYETKRIYEDFPELIEYIRGENTVYANLKDKFYRNMNFKRFIKFYIKQCSLFKENGKRNFRDIIWNHFNELPSSIMNEQSLYEFEGIRVRGLKDFHTFLSTIYGDYMELPPKEKRTNHGIKAWRKN